MVNAKIVPNSVTLCCKQ